MRDQAPSYQRHGTCHGCGQHCCTSVSLPLTHQQAEDFLAHQPVWVEPEADPDYQKWLALHGIAGDRVWMLPHSTRFYVIGRKPEGRVPIATIPLRCHALSDDGSCALYDSPDRPQMCAEWPWEPLHLETMTLAGRHACGYSFTKENT